jgi:FkbM family methyltransferase
MILSKPVARFAIEKIALLSSLPLATKFPFTQLARALNHRAIPRIAELAYSSGTQEVNGILMDIPPPPSWGGGGEFHMALGTYEAAEIAFILSRLSPGDTFLDVGAHIGYFTLPAARRVGSTGRVFAVEPSPASMDLLKRNVELNGFSCVTLIHGAASDRDGQATFTISSRSPMWNTLRGEALGDKDSTSITVSTRSVDSIVAEAGWPKVAGLKLDVEGAESEVLNGAIETLSRNPSAFVVFEISGGNQARIDASMHTLGWFESRGYCFRRLSRNGSSELVSAGALKPLLQRREWYEYLMNVSAELPR